LANVGYVGPARYFLTFCTLGRLPVFRDPEIVAMTLAQFRTTAAQEGFAILAYCLMPDHVHLLVEALADTSDLRRFVKLGKQRAGGKYARTHLAPLWQPGYYERILREHDDSKEVARYIINNPVRAGLVENPADYPHLGSDVWPHGDLFESVML
jgi:REP element-mobilizing transposase RayT